MVSNRGELARGWYERVVAVLRGGTAEEVSTRPPIPERPKAKDDDEDDDDDEDSDVGPPIPGQERRKRDQNRPGRPTFDDLEVAKSELAYSSILNHDFWLMCKF